jgi:hypothetical protein
VHGAQHVGQHVVGFDFEVVGLAAQWAHGGCPGGRRRG